MSPKSKIEQTYAKIRAEMTNSFEDLDGWLNPDYATYGNRRNTYTGDNSEKYTSAPVIPVIYDYIFYKKNASTPFQALFLSYFTNFLVKFIIIKIYKIH